MTRAVLVILILLVLATGGYASADDAVPPPTFPNHGAVSSTPRIAHEPATSLSLGKYRIVLENTTLFDVQRIVSIGSIQHRGDAGESLYWLCYTVRHRGEDQRVWIASSEMGGRTHAIDVIVAEIVEANQSVSASCPLLPNRLQKISLNKHAWLGSTLSGLIHRLGKPRAEANGILTFDYDGKTPNPVKKRPNAVGVLEEADVTSSLAVQAEGDKVVRLWASKTTTF